MKRAAGFTLIELVIVIVILGILGAVAAPRFINLQGDAYEANINALKGSIQSAATLANTRAVLDGNEDATGAAGDLVTGFDGVAFVDGYPAAGTEDGEWVDGILGALQDIDVDAYAIAEVAGADPAAITIRPANRDNATCQITYTQADGATPPDLAVVTTGCNG